MKESLQEQLARLTQSGELRASKSSSSATPQETQVEPMREGQPKPERYEALVREIDDLRSENQALTEELNKRKYETSIELHKTLERLSVVTANSKNLEDANQALAAENLELKGTIEQLPDARTITHWQEKVLRAEAMLQEVRQTAQQLDKDRQQLVNERSVFEIELKRLNELDVEIENMAVEHQKLLRAREELDADIDIAKKTEKAQSLERVRLEKLSVELQALQARVGHLKAVERSFKDLEEEHGKQLVLNKRNKTRIRNLTSEKDQAIQDLSEKQAELKVTSRNLKDALNQLAAVPDGELIIRSFETVQWLTCQFIDPHEKIVPKRVLLIGDGPWPIARLTDLLKNLGFEVWRNRYRGDVEVVIVGRENWSEVDLERQVEGRDGKPLRVYPQELFVLLLAMNADPLAFADPDALRNFVHGHPVFEFLFNLEFPWPETDFEDGPPATIGEGFDGEDASSPLYKLGYSVAQQVDLSIAERRKVLDETYAADVLPWCISDDYMEDWGEPNSRKRLRRIAWHLYLMTRRLKRHEEAVARWSSDLNWLKQTYYKPIHRFRWPS